MSHSEHCSSKWLSLGLALLVPACSAQLGGGIVDDDGDFGLGQIASQGDDSEKEELEDNEDEESAPKNESGNEDATSEGDEKDQSEKSEPKPESSSGGTSSEGDGSETDAEDKTSGSEEEKVSGDLKISFETVSYSGRFAPRNAGVVWIETEDGTFLRTLKKWALVRTVHLVRWRKASDSDLTDAITGATLKGHQAHNLEWDRKDSEGKTHGVGDYVLRIEFTEANSDGRDKPGPTFKLPFHLGGGEKTLKPDDVKGFRSIEVVTPD